MPVLQPVEWDQLWAMMDDFPHEWVPTTEHMHDEMLGAVPPRAGGHGLFLVGEANHHNANGEAVYACFREVGGEYTARYLTVREYEAFRRR